MVSDLSTYAVAVLFTTAVAAAVAWSLQWASSRNKGEKGDNAHSYAAEAKLALLRPPRALYPWVKPRGVMNLRSLPDDCNGLLLDVDSNYLVQLELKKVLFRTPNLRASVFGDTSSTDAALAARSRQASIEALELTVNRLQNVDCMGLVEQVQGRLVNVATGYHWPWPASQAAASSTAGVSESIAGAAPPKMSSVKNVQDSRGDLEEEHPLVLAALLVQEDLVIMLPQQANTEPKENAAPSVDTPNDTNHNNNSGSHEEEKAVEEEEEYVLACAAVCFSDQWSVSDKIGLSLHQVHAPAHTYTKVAKATASFFQGLKPGFQAAKVRYNFTFCERPSLHMPAPPTSIDCPLGSSSSSSSSSRSSKESLISSSSNESSNSGWSSDNKGSTTNSSSSWRGTLPHSLYVRVERQVLLRLPQSGAVLFTIRTYVSNVLDVPMEHRSPLLDALELENHLTPISKHQKERYGPLIRGMYGNN